MKICVNNVCRESLSRLNRLDLEKNALVGI